MLKKLLKINWIGLEYGMRAQPSKSGGGGVAQAAAECGGGLQITDDES